MHELEESGAHGAETALPCGSHFKCQLHGLSDSSRASGYPLVPQRESSRYLRLATKPAVPRMTLTVAAAPHFGRAGSVITIARSSCEACLGLARLRTRKWFTPKPRVIDE